MYFLGELATYYRAFMDTMNQEPVTSLISNSTEPVLILLIISGFLTFLGGVITKKWINRPSKAQKLIAGMQATYLFIIAPIILLLSLHTLIAIFIGGNPLFDPLIYIALFVVGLWMNIVVEKAGSFSFGGPGEEGLTKEDLRKVTRLLGAVTLAWLPAYLLIQWNWLSTPHNIVTILAIFSAIGYSKVGAEEFTSLKNLEVEVTTDKIRESGILKESEEFIYIEEKDGSKGTYIPRKDVRSIKRFEDQDSRC